MRSRGRPLVLIAGNARRLRTAVDAVLAESRAKVRFFANGPDLMDAVLDYMSREMAPDVLIVDDDLAGYGGLNMVASMRNAGYRSAIYVMTPISRATAVAAVARRLSACVVQRPVTAEALIVAIERAELVRPTGEPGQRRDRRRWPRVPVRLAAELRDGHHCCYTGVITDISLAGMRMHVEVADALRLPVGRSIEVSFDTDRSSVSLPCVVRRRGEAVGEVELGLRLELEGSDALEVDAYGRWLFTHQEAFLRDRARATRSLELDELGDVVAQLA